MPEDFRFRGRLVMIAATRPPKARPRTVRTPARRQNNAAKEKRNPKWAPGWKPDAPQPPSWAAVVSGRGREDAAAADKEASGAPGSSTPEMDTTDKGEPEKEESPTKPQCPRGGKGGAPKGPSVRMDDLPKIVAQMQALLPALVTMLSAPDPSAAVEAAAEGGGGFGPAEFGGAGKDRCDPYGK